LHDAYLLMEHESGETATGPLTSKGASAAGPSRGAAAAGPSRRRAGA
jgi:hypothetical protein